jgi:hypothetical protein
MRTLLQIVIPVEPGNKAIKDQALGKLLEKTFSAIKPEGAYFLSMHGRRCCLAFFDLKSPADIPPIAEPLFMELNAEVEFIPVMNSEELHQGLSRLT